MLDQAPRIEARKWRQSGVCGDSESQSQICHVKGMDFFCDECRDGNVRNSGYVCDECRDGKVKNSGYGRTHSVAGVHGDEQLHLQWEKNGQSRECRTVND